MWGLCSTIMGCILPKNQDFAEVTLTIPVLSLLGPKDKTISEGFSVYRLFSVVHRKFSITSPKAC